MLSDIRKYSEPVKFSYMLMKPDGYIYDDDNKRYYEIYEELMYLQYLTANIEFNLSGFDELNISIPKFITKRQQTVTNPAWERLQGDYIVEVSNNISDKKQRFIIDIVETDVDDKYKKNVHAYSLEWEFSHKNLRKFSSKTLTKDNQELDETWYLRDIINHINTTYMENTWSIGHIDSNVATKRRSFEVSSQSAWTFLKSLQESFCCIFKFDTINRTIDVLDATVYPVCPKCHRPEYLVYYGSTLECHNPDCYIDVDDKIAEFLDSDSTMDIVDEDGKHRTVLAKDGEKVNWTTTVYGKDTGLYLSERNYINDFKETRDMSELATRLYVYGKDDLGINTATLNYSGQPYLEDFSYFRNKKYMTQELLDALDRYDALYETKKGVWKELNDEYYDLLRQYSEAVVVPERGQSLLDELEFEVKSITRLSQIQASGSSTEKLDTLLKETFKDYNEQIIHYLDADGTVQEKKIVELLEDLSETITDVEGYVVDISKAIKAINDSFEYQFDIMEQALKNDINLEDYSLNQLEEALKVYNARIDVLNNISKNVISADINSELTTGKTWKTGDQIYYRCICENTEPSTTNATVTFDNFDSPYTLSDTTSEGYFEFNLPSQYTKAIRNNDYYKLELWLAKKLSDGKYDDRVLQTENVHYYVMETGNTSGAVYKIRQNNIDLTVIKNALEAAIETKKGVVASIEELQEKNTEKTTALKMSLNKATATDEQGNLIFTEALIRELNRFIIEKEYTNENIGVADINTDIQTKKYKERVDELYQDGMTVFYSKSTPLVEFNIDIVNFMRDIRYQKDWDKISLGDMIHITHSDASKKDYIVRITQIQWNPTDNFLQLTLSNEDKLTSGQGFMEKMIRKINTTATTVSVQKEKWNNAQSNAVDEILNTGWNDGLSKMYEKTDITLNEYGITMANLLDKNKQTRMNSNMLIFTEDNWNTVKTAISNGDIFAERLVGRIILGTMAYLSGYKADGTTGTCRIDGDGVLIDNGSLNVKPMDGNYANSNGITISPEPDGGIICTGYDENAIPVYRLRMNGKTGFNIFSLNANGEEKEKMFHANIDGQLMANGDIYCKRLFLQGMNGDVATAMDALKLNDKGNTSIGGNYVDAKGIQVTKGSKTTFEVSEDGDVTGRDCVFRDGTFTGTFEAGSITSNTTINVGTDGIFGDNITLGKHSTTGTLKFGGMTSTPTAKISGYENNGKFLELEAENILLDVATDGGGKVYVGSVRGGNEVVTQKDLEELIGELHLLKGRVSALENHLGI